MNVNFELKDDTLFDEINKIHTDSYVSFVIESSGDFINDCRYTEKTIRPFLYKNIFFTIGSNGFNKGLKERGIETFNDLFELDDNWDETSDYDISIITNIKNTDLKNKVKNYNYPVEVDISFGNHERMVEIIES